ncbi:MAG TPA: amylo-alpha-1,6-glucosidase [Verrucomicrobiae bacterium]|nr:amylo-alpha-1,6-glucosidase [Verrucomicrobiae bacterium]
MSPAPGGRLVRFVGDQIRFQLRLAGGEAHPRSWRARLRTNLGRADALRREIVNAHAKGAPPAGAAWRDLPMEQDEQGWFLQMPLAETGYFKAKGYLLDDRGWQHWPSGPDYGIAVHPDWTRTANIIYCAFPRLHGRSKSALRLDDPQRDTQFKQLEAEGHAIISPSGKLRDLIPQLPHIVSTLGCRILHLLPIGPTPTTFARFGRFGSPYACLDLTAIDPALVEFDRRTTGVDQFRELALAVHRHGARVFLDIVINHTGWGSTLQEQHPQWFVRNPGGEFHSPGAWGTTWEDLVELKQDSVALWDVIAESLLVWCRRGVDGFRCDAGYMVPMPAWQYIIARVQQEFPDVVFLLEGLGGAWEATETLLTEGGMQWAYSELFQNYSAVQVGGYLDHALKQSQRVGMLIHYAETHDNARLAARGRAWSLLRNRLCALASVSGGFGFTGGVEWLAEEKIKVHGCTGLNWGAPNNIIPELAQLNRLLAWHPAFFDGATLTRVSTLDSDVFALFRESAEGKDAVLVLVNLDPDQPREIKLPVAKLAHATPAHVGAEGRWLNAFDLLGQPVPEMAHHANQLRFKLPAGAAYCLAATLEPMGLHGDGYRQARARAAWAVACLCQVHPPETVGAFDWLTLAAEVEASPARFLAAASRRGPRTETSGAAPFPNVIRWAREDARRITLIPPHHWLLLEDDAPFRATLAAAQPENAPPNDSPAQHICSVVGGKTRFACFPPRTEPLDAVLTLERLTEPFEPVIAAVRFLPAEPVVPQRRPLPEDLVLLTNGRGGMARLCVDLGRVNSKYDCVLGANLHPTLPVDRHVFAKRLRVWVNADGFITPLDYHNLASFHPGPPAVWQFVAQAGDGRTVELQLAADMLPGRNTTLFRFSRPNVSEAHGKQLPAEANVRLTVRVDIEDRNFHSETKHNGGADHHFTVNTHPLAAPAIGFAFTPARDRQLRVVAGHGIFHPQPEWCFNVPHPVEATRGQTGAGDVYSPGWFELAINKGDAINLIVTAEAADPTDAEVRTLADAAGRWQAAREAGRPLDSSALQQAARAFVVRRGEGRTVIAGYPWFLDWGRDTLICARGLLAAGMIEEVREILLTFARFEEKGTLPNIIHGEHVGNRDTSDAPLWFGIVCEELAGRRGAADFYATPVEAGKRPLAEVLRSIAAGYLAGTPNGIHVDAASGLVWSPGHFTWMDTNYPAGTPREGYPIEIQCLWIRLLRQLDRIGARPAGEPWSALADRATRSLEQFFWLEEPGWFADSLRAERGMPAARSAVDDALRSNGLFTVSLGLIHGERAQRMTEAVRRWLVVPGGLRSLAPLPVKLPLDIRHHGQLLNDPRRPYCGRYEGDEDTRRKPAYHNGTAWTWTFPVFCEALARAWEASPEAVAAARAYLTSSFRLLDEGCLGQIPEVLDGDAPHRQRGCDAQAWGATEALRVWQWLAGC